MVRPPAYVPERGHVIWLDFRQTRGHEQSGRRPALVLSTSDYNGFTGLMVACPITSKIKKHNFEVQIVVGGRKSVVLSDHVRSLDWADRKPEFIAVSELGVLTQVLENIRALLYF